MPFDMGFNFRATAGYVTDPSYAVPVLGEAYPHTYTNVDGKSINAGWTMTGNHGAANIASGNDPRIAGYIYQANDGTPSIFTVDLSSGSAPGAGTYTVDLAIGAPEQGGAIVCDAKLKDNTTTLIDLTNAGAGYGTAAGHFIDATVADVAATTAWTGATVDKAWATTTVQLEIGVDSITSKYTTPAHFRLTLAGGGQSVVPVLMAQYRQRRS